ncbi:hypothetical protein KFK09_008308 [Dendrobium nobile]|uniref:Uncharacterized protein n=1 Tax=Dendrobium nobile TaxID=94219 RepID=A0A8T3BKC9_DENNO|nr:hypothetical protein KFK09_008307 [Dendrobium nobile]KAI0515642.1 hypothetical protein KFK09_008308 [Dendrobium nobile]
MLDPSSTFVRPLRSLSRTDPLNLPDWKFPFSCLDSNIFTWIELLQLKGFKKQKTLTALSPITQLAIAFISVSNTIGFLPFVQIIYIDLTLLFDYPYPF